MGLLTCATCGCAITAERKKGKYVYYHCTGFHGSCDNVYIREERLADLLGSVVAPVQMTEEVAQDIAAALRESDAHEDRHRQQTVCQLDQGRRDLTNRLDRGYDDVVGGRISEVLDHEIARMGDGTAGRRVRDGAD